MRFIANILTNRKFEDNELYNIVTNKEDLIKDIPTLVVGWEYTKKMYPEANILDWKINDDIFWTFGNRERRQRYDETVIKFRKYTIEKLVKSINYKFISMFNNDGLDNLNYILNNFNGINIYINNDIIYLTGSDKKVVYGFSLKEYDYISKNRKELLKRIFESGNNIIDIKDSLSNEMKISLYNHSYVIPCLY
jgi:hypothetical protein